MYWRGFVRLGLRAWQKCDEIFIRLQNTHEIRVGHFNARQHCLHGRQLRQTTEIDLKSADSVSPYIAQIHAIFWALCIHTRSQQFFAKSFGFQMDNYESLVTVCASQMRLFPFIDSL